MVISNDGLQAGVQGFQLGLVAKLKKVWAEMSIYSRLRDVADLTLHEFTDLWSDGVADCMQVSEWREAKPNDAPDS